MNERTKFTIGDLNVVVRRKEHDDETKFSLMITNPYPSDIAGDYLQTPEAEHSPKLKEFIRGSELQCDVMLHQLGSPEKELITSEGGTHFTRKVKFTQADVDAGLTLEAVTAKLTALESEFKLRDTKRFMDNMASAIGLDDTQIKVLHKGFEPKFEEESKKTAPNYQSVALGYMNQMSSALGLSEAQKKTIANGVGSRSFQGR